MKGMFSQIIVGVIVTVIGGFLTNALVRGHGKRANAQQHSITLGDRR